MVSASAENEIIKFYTSWSCPYAQRAWITLNHLNVRYDLIESFSVDKEKNTLVKNEKLLKINPKGLVPTLDVKGEIVVESIDIIEYLHKFTKNDESNPSFVTAELMADAKTYDKMSSNFYGIYFKPEGTEREESWNGLKESLKNFVDQVQPDGYFKSSQMNVVDISIFPIVIRMCLLETYRKKKLDESLAWTQKLKKWVQRMKEDRAVSSTVADETKLKDAFKHTLVRWGVYEEN